MGFRFNVYCCLKAFYNPSNILEQTTGITNANPGYAGLKKSCVVVLRSDDYPAVWNDACALSATFFSVVTCFDSIVLIDSCLCGTIIVVSFLACVHAQQ
jgi:hypothetical protein